MPPDVQVDDEHVHVLDAGGVARSRLPTTLSVVAVLLLAGGGAWVALTDPFGVPDTAAAPLPAEGNLLGDAWSFETTGSTHAEAAWTADGDGFAFLGEPGQRSARAQPGQQGWARLWTAEAFALGAHRGSMQLSATSDSADIRLLLRFESDDRPPLDVVVASGSGTLQGSCPVPPGSNTVRAGIACAGTGAVDNVDLRRVEGGNEPLSSRGIFRLLRLPQGLAIFRGDELVFHLSGPTLFGDGGPALPVAVAPLPGEGAVALPDGQRVAWEASAEQDGPRLVLQEVLQGAPDHAVAVRETTVTGSLAAAGVGIVSARGFERFSGDFRVEGVRALVLGRTQDRLVFSVDGEAVLSGSFPPDGTIRVRWETDPKLQRFVLQTGFQDERVAAAQHRDTAWEHERAGRLGAALAEAERILREFPYDDAVLADAAALRGRIQIAMQRRLDAIDADLEDALFLASARRCREVLADCQAAAGTYSGSEAEARFRERAGMVAERASDLLEEDRARRAARVRAIMESFREHGGYDLVAEEMQRYLDTTLAPGGQTR